MQRRTAAACLVAASGLLLLSQLRLLPQDQGVLLEVSGRPVDAAGHMQGAWLRLVRRCGTVTTLADGSAAWQEAQRVLAGYSPPASLAARPVQVLSWGQGDAKGAERFARASTHWMRHSHASHAIAGGMPIEIAQQNLGHASLATTTVYVTTESKRRMKAVERFWGAGGAAGKGGE